MNRVLLKAMYVNAYSISNINLKGLKGLSYLKYHEDRLKQFLNKNTGMEVLIQVGFKVTHPADDEDDEGNAVRQVIKLRSRRFDILNTDDITDVLTKIIDDINIRIERSYLSDSNIAIDKLYKIAIHYDKSNPARAGSYIELPKWVSSNKACVNIKNEDNKFFKYCVQCFIFKIYEKDNPERMRHYNKFNATIINWGCMKFPCSRTCIDIVEEDNHGLIFVNVYKLLNETTITDRITKVNTKHEMHLLMIEQEDNFHYVLIKHLSKMVGCQYNKHIKKMQICPHCLRGVQSIETLTKQFEHGC